MTRQARIILPHEYYHVTQRGSRRDITFFGDEDYRMFVRMLAHFFHKCLVQVLAYCLMPNHTHLLALPSSREGLSESMRLSQQTYSRIINKREDWKGALVQGRFYARHVPPQQRLAVARYIERNPMDSLVQRPQDWLFSSARAHLRGEDDELCEVAPLLALEPDWGEVILKPWPAHDEYRLDRQRPGPRPRMVRHPTWGPVPLLGPD